MRKALHVVAWVVLVATSCAASMAAGSGNVNLFLGQKSLNGDWKDDSINLDVSKQAELGALLTWSGENWPVGLAVDLLSSSDDQTIVFGGTPFKFEGSTTEIDFGVRKIWENSKTRPFFGAGLGYVKGELKGSAGGVSVPADDGGLGEWIDGGVFWRLGSHFNLGVEGRYTKARITPSVGGASFALEAGGFHFGVILGFGWGE